MSMCPDSHSALFSLVLSQQQAPLVRGVKTKLKPAIPGNHSLYLLDDYRPGTLSILPKKMESAVAFEY